MANNNLITVDSLANILKAFKESIEVDNATAAAVTEPEYLDVPVINITGTLPTSKDYVSCKVEYTSKTESFVGNAQVKLQGNSSLSHPKKNYTIQLAKSREFKEWDTQNTFTLKADYIDVLRVRNVCASRLWGKIVQTRSSCPEELKSTPTFGAIDGFPVKVFLNGEYAGLYNFTTYKGAKLFGMSDNNTNHALLQAEFNDNGDDNYATNPCNFNTSWDGSSTYFSTQVGSASSSAIVSAFNNIYYSLGSSNLENYLDIDSLIDYYIFQDVILGTDGLAKNMLLATYDMTKWHLSAYDLDATFDLSWEGNILNASNTSIFNSDGNLDVTDPYLNVYNQLLREIGTYYWDRYKARYAELRNSVLSYSSIMAEIENYFRAYADLYIEETSIYPDIPAITENTIAHIREFVKQHLNHLDSLYLN